MAVFGLQTGDPGFDPNMDHDDDGIIGFADGNIFVGQLHQGRPGPSGLH